MSKTIIKSAGEGWYYLAAVAGVLANYTACSFTMHRRAAPSLVVGATPVEQHDDLLYSDLLQTRSTTSFAEQYPMAEVELAWSVPGVSWVRFLRGLQFAFGCAGNWPSKFSASANRVRTNFRSSIASLLK
ncbi:hypothetical protein L6654_01245 [Bradyrhizobium sp. WYCCWR 13023]|uniref:Uncharacterized protein n=1 Tax=Bradyrhizobium zhengyangense TaxID=2911009 RepID=A0A9X1U5X2_9BRAD|nr:hypothetical protein [Bradyrhizobium zhengyangense]MCG2625231.1 hypothetical protein [Bradyrhizobium zhengyangense]